MRLKRRLASAFFVPLIISLSLCGCGDAQQTALFSIAQPPAKPTHFQVLSPDLAVEETPAGLAWRHAHAGAQPFVLKLAWDRVSFDWYWLDWYKTMRVELVDRDGNTFEIFHEYRNAWTYEVEIPDGRPYDAAWVERLTTTVDFGKLPGIGDQSATVRIYVGGGDGAPFVRESFSFNLRFD